MYAIRSYYGERSPEVVLEGGVRQDAQGAEGVAGGGGIGRVPLWGQMPPGPRPGSEDRSQFRSGTPYPARRNNFV